jgi:hypothetical protein
MTNKKYLKEVLRNLTPLLKIPKSRRSAVIPLLSDGCIHKICESCQNLLKNTYGFDRKKLRKIRNKFKSGKNEIRLFARPTSSLLRKRKILANEQTGGGIFTVLASAIIPAIIAALSK